MNNTPKHSGFSLIELMVALALSFIVLLAVTAIFANTSRSRVEMEKSNRQTENGRYASELLANNLRMAGYLAEFDPTPLTTSGLTALPDICATATADLINALPLHVQGVNDASTTPSCLSDLKGGTDILAIRRVSSCVAGSGDCAAVVSGIPHFQTSLCNPIAGGSELAMQVNSNSDYATHQFTLSTNTADFTKHKANCTTIADVRRYLVHIYFIANNNLPGDGVPTLKCAELGANAFTIVPLVDGIENLQVDYGIDSNSDGIPDAYTQNPSAYGGCSGTACVSNWRNVMSARVSLLARNVEVSAGHTDNRTYALGLNEDGTQKTVGPFGDRIKRHVFSETSRFANPAWRRQ